MTLQEKTSIKYLIQRTEIHISRLQNLRETDPQLIARTIWEENVHLRQFFVEIKAMIKSGE